MWATSINRLWNPSKMSTHSSPFPILLRNIHSSVPTGRHGCMSTRALAWHYDKHSLWLRVPPKSSRSSSLPSCPCLLGLSAPAGEDGVTALPRVCSDTVSTLISHHVGCVVFSTWHPSNLPNSFSSIHSHLPFSITVPRSKFLFLLSFYTMKLNRSIITSLLYLLRVIPVLILTCDVYNLR